jgi:dolichol kinase
MRMKNINMVLLFLMSIITGMGAIIGVKFGEKL